ncbi:hypothetical protein [Microbacterium sp. VKM Ac-2923]|uniref:hypothetical protein n=1 Tax=Microbacterium sp. VKM Ac-2923 TaxID=2929476 RepID=UPI001FB404EE|nr:hypothetical protein [Microbacterium sp. VKM Ac-2923]MCJ1708569.1 hypothetical protein [Microbacterium sp. VKM Ac-2923]
MTAFATSLRVEQRKVTTVHLWWILLGALAVVSLAAPAGLVVIARAAPMSPLTFATSTEVLVALNIIGALGYIVPLGMGVLIYSSDLARRTLALTLLGEPRRLRVYLAKLVVAAAFGAVAGAVTAVTGAVSGVMAFQATGSLPGDAFAAAVVDLLPVIPVFALWSALGVGLGALVGSPVVAIVGVVVVTQVVEPVARVLAASSGLPDAVAFFPGAAHDAAIGGTLMTLASGAEPPSALVGAFVLLAYAAVFVTAGAVRAQRYELT